MNKSFKILKGNLQREFNWLRKNYPIDSFDRVDLKIYDYKDYNGTFGEEGHEEYDSKEIDGFVVDNVSQNHIEFAIFLILNEEYVPDDVDRKVMEKGSIVNDHLFFFMLYHEYGHLIHLHKTYEKHGYRGLLDEREEVGDLLDKLLYDYNVGKIKECELNEAYRELWFEKKADNFAYDVYNDRKNFL